jgi:hypothetical protein
MIFSAGSQERSIKKKRTKKIFPTFEIFWHLEEKNKEKL